MAQQYAAMLSNDSESYSYYYEDVYSLPRMDQAAVHILSPIFILGVVVSTVGNIVVILVITCKQNSKASFNTLILNLAISDWTLSLLCLPFVFTSAVMGEWIFGDVICRLAPFALKVSEIVSILTLTAIGTDRYHAIMYPLKEKLTTRKKIILVVIIWVTAAVICTPYALYHSVRRFPIEDNRRASLCLATWPSSGFAVQPKEAYIWTMFFSTYVLPLLILGVCYFRAAFKLGRRKLPGSSNQTRDKQQLRVKRKAMATLISAVILFAICWLPVHVYNLFFLTYNPQYLQSRPKITMTARACVFVWMVIVDAVINPVIYVFISDRFKRDICRLSFTCRRAVKRFRVKSSGKETTSCKTTMSDLRTTSQQRSSAMLQTYKKCLSKDNSDKMALKSML